MGNHFLKGFGCDLAVKRCVTGPLATVILIVFPKVLDDYHVYAHFEMDIHIHWNIMIF